MSKVSFRSRLVLLPALLIAVLPVAASGSPDFERVNALTLGGDSALYAAVIDPDATHA